MYDAEIPCPGCKRRVFSLQDILYAPLDGTACCRVCGRFARLDLFSRWMISCAIALILPALLLYWELFYSGHLFVISILVILVAWRILTLLAFPILALEIVRVRTPVDRKQSVVILAILLMAAMMLDSLMASRFEPEETAQTKHLTSNRPR
jgi:hypothetical protein